MTRITLLLSVLVLVLLVAFPLLYVRERHETFRNFRVVDEGVLYRSGQMSPAGIGQVCREKGIRTVISLRDEEKQADDVDDEEAVCRRNGVVLYETITPKGWEVENGVVPMEANLRLFAARLDGPITDPQTGRLLPRFQPPILVHCFAGIHRTGAHVAVYRVKRHGYTPGEAVLELKACGKPTTTFVGNLIPFLRDHHLPAVFEQVHGRPVGGATDRR